jgi:diguanylate cyclase (GGDEF)-like protein
MKNILLVPVIFFLSFFLFSQEDQTGDFFFTSMDEEISLLIEKARKTGESDPASMLFSATEAYELSISEGSVTGQINALATMGKAYFYLQEYDKSIQALTESYNTSAQVEYTEGLWYSSFNLGIIYRYIEDTEKAVRYMEEADALVVQENDSRHISIYTELAALYKEQKMYEKALLISSKASTIALNLDDTQSVLSLSLQQGDIYYLAGDIRKASNLFEFIILKTSSFGEFQNLRASAMSQIGKCYALLGDYHLALANGQDALLLAAKNDSVTGRIEAYEALSFIYQNMGDYDQAFSNLQLYYRQKEILDKEKRSSNLNNIKAYYQTFEKEQEIDKQQVQISIQNRLILTGSFVMAICVVLILILFILYRKHSRTALKLNRELKQEMELTRRDHVTGLPNNKFIEDSLREAILKWKREQSVFSLVFISFESLKKIDQEQGAGTGAEIQKYISRLLKIELKGQDIVSLWKPFLFLLLLPDTDSSSSDSVIQRLITKFDKENFIKGETPLELPFKIGQFTYAGEGNRSYCIDKCREAITSY